MSELSRSIDFNENSEKLLLAALKERLGFSPEMRIEAHENARRLLLDLQRAGEDLRAGFKKTSDYTSRK